MSHATLYRKYRPGKWGEVLGQEAIVSALEAAISRGAISHAYLFSGTRGTGKTSIARIFARAIGCADSDLYEIDAASNRGIDDIRELRESVKTVPFESPYKVYIVDEAHMLTKEAFNALLKTLEEPPAHIVFILATTEPHKLPDTIVSRCQHFIFKKPAKETLAAHLRDIAQREGRELEPAAAELVALLGDGSFRDALVAFQKILSLAEGKSISAEEVSRLAGLPASATVNDFLSAAAEKDAPRALAVLRAVSEANTDIGVFLKLAIVKLRAALLLAIAPEMKTTLSLEFTAEDFAFLREFSSRHAKILARVLVLFLETAQKTTRSFIPSLPLEIALARMCQTDAPVVR